MWTAGKDAVRHGAVLARIGVWGVGAKVRADFGRLFATLVAAAAMVAIAVTAAVWTTARVLGELSAILGGGLGGSVLAVVILLAIVVTAGRVRRFFRVQERAAAWRRKLDPATSTQLPRTPARVQLDRLRQDALTGWRHDKEKLRQRGAAIWRMHPVTSLGVGAASGFFASRWLLATPHNVRRGAVGVLRLARSLGIASLANTALETLGARRVIAPSTVSPTSSTPAA
ncbi:MAG TPA: hypothetical protein VFZ65_00515 [Planctomycetota bacterium]|nr:hypothetical protein [Planctomycetota bacterium]